VNAAHRLEIRGLVVRRGPCAVIDGLDLTASAGAVTALVGPNGAGKSTVLKAVLGLLPSSGAMRIGGDDLRTMGAVARAKRIAWVPQRSQLAAALSVEAVVAAGRFAQHGGFGAPGRVDRLAAHEALAVVDGEQLATRTFDALSVGEQQRVLVARALASGAGCILLDEPTAALDVGHALDLLALIRRLADEGRCIAVVLHDLEQVRRVADQVALIHRGRVQAAGAPDAVLAAEPLRAAFAVRPVPGGALGFERAEAAP
jgi:iron complex transport system ATP-binding protein